MTTPHPGAEDWSSSANQMPTALDSTPDEVLLTIFGGYTLSKEDWKNLRLVSRAFERPASTLLFKAIAIDPWEENQKLDLMSRFGNDIKKITIAPFKDAGKPVTNFPMNPPSLRSCCDLIKELPNLESVYFKNGRLFKDLTRSYMRNTKPLDPFKALSFLFAALTQNAGGNEDSGKGITALQIDFIFSNARSPIAHTENFPIVMGHLKQLRLGVSLPGILGNGSSDDESPALFQDLTAAWLGKSTGLEDLSLDFSNHMDFCPKLHFGSLHHAKLSKLQIKKLFFSHRWLLDWINSHAATLQDLELKQCSIIVHLTVRNDYYLSDDGYSIHRYPPPPGSRGERSMRDLLYGSLTSSENRAIRWYELYESFQNNLRMLKRFSTESHVGPSLRARYVSGYFGRTDHTDASRLAQSQSQARDHQALKNLLISIGQEPEEL